MRDDAAVVAGLLTRIGKGAVGELKGISHQFAIKHEDLERVAADVLQGSLEMRCHRVAAHFVPSHDRTETQFKQLAQSYPLSFFFPQAILDPDGRTVAHLGGVEHDLPGRVVRQMAQNIAFESPFLNYVLMKLRKGTSVTDLLGVLFASPVFDRRVESVLRTGLSAYFADDPIVSVHLLVPQIEGALRRLLELTGGAPIKPRRGGGFHYKNLDDLLREPEIEEIFGADFIFYTSVMLTDQRGLNARHDLAHGLMHDERLTSVLSDRIVHILFVLSRVQGKAAPES